MSKTFRLFISSTFSDFKEERRLLHEEIFPEIKTYCFKYGFNFQPIDLRWGVDPEIAIEQKTLDLCLEEVRACKANPHPNFLIMVGNRYGWVPLPQMIEKNEFETIKQWIEKNQSPSDVAFLNHWYILDENYFPKPHYYLRELYSPTYRRPVDFATFPLSFQGDYITPSLDKDFNEFWFNTENTLRDLLQLGAKECFGEHHAIYEKYITSATEQEAIEGIYKFKNLTSFQESFLSQRDISNSFQDKDSEHIICVIRDIKNKEYVAGKPTTKHCIETETDALNSLTKLLRETLSDENILQGEKALVTISTDEKKVVYDTDYLKEFTLFIVNQLKQNIDNYVKSYNELVQYPLKIEMQEHLRFKSIKTETFYGRELELAYIEQYIKESSLAPLVIHGSSGMGKSALLAKAINDAEDSLNYDIVYRFIGISPKSMHIRNLLESIVDEMIERSLVEVDSTFAYEREDYKFFEQIKSLFENTSKLIRFQKETVLFLDSLDQLHSLDMLTWMPQKFSPFLKIVLSTLDESPYEHYYDLLKSIYGVHNTFLKLNGLQNVELLIDALLHKENRKITQEQTHILLKNYHQAGDNPLYLVLAIHEVKHWKSVDTPKNNHLGITLEDNISKFIDNLHAVYHHEKRIVERVLGYIAASKYGLSEEELLQILSQDQEVMLASQNDFNRHLNIKEFPSSIWARLYYHLKPFLIEKSIDEQNLLSFFHRKIKEVVDEKVYIPNKTILHRNLAQYFLTLQDESQTWNKRYSNAHMLEELPYQLYHANEFSKLKSILCNLEFAGAVYDHYKHKPFQDIFDNVLQLENIDADELYPWLSFYREKGHLIHQVDEDLWRPHQSLFQLAYEDGLDSPLTHAAEKLLEESKVTFNWLKRNWRDEHFYRSGLLKIIAEQKSIFGVEKLSLTKLVSWDIDNIISFWSVDLNSCFKSTAHSKKVNGILKSDFNNIFSWAEDKIIIKWENESPSIYFKGHTDFIKGVKQFNDGRILSWSQDHTLRIWDKNGKCLKILDSHDGAIEKVLMNSNEKFVSYAMGECGAILWDTKGQLLKELTHDNLNTPLSGIIIFENNNIVLWGYGFSLFFLVNNESNIIEIPTNHKGWIIDVIQLNNHRFLSYAENDPVMKLWFDGKLVTDLIGHQGEVYGVIQLKNGDIISWASDTLIKMWNSEGTFLQNYMWHKDSVICILELTDHSLASWSKDNTFQIHKKSGELKVHYNIEAMLILNVIELTSGILSIWMKNGLIILLDLNYQNLKLKPFNVDNGLPKIVKLLRNNILSITSNGTMEIFNSNGQMINLCKDDFFILDAAQHKNENIVTWSISNEIKIWDKNLILLNTLRGHTKKINGVLELSDSTIFSWSDDCKCIKWHKNGDITQFIGHKDAVIGCMELKNGNILSWSEDQTLRLWSKNGKCIKLMKKHSFIVKGALVLNTENILSWSDDQKLILWSKSGKFIQTVDNKIGWIQNIKQLKNQSVIFAAFHPWDEAIRKNTITILTSELEKIQMLDEILEPITEIVELSCGKILLISDNVKFYILDFETKKILEFIGHNSKIMGIKEINNTIFSWGSSGIVYQWNSLGNCIAKFVMLNERNITLNEWINGNTLLATMGNKITPYSLVSN